MSKTKKIILISVLILTGIFIVSFLVFDRYLEDKLMKEDVTKETIVSKDSDTVLDNSILITLHKDGNLEKSKLLKDLKAELNLSGDVTVQTLSSSLSGQGYKFETAEANELIFNRSLEDSVEVGKYYITKSGDYLAIGKGTKDGKIVIENDDDIYKENKKFSTLPDNDQKKIMNNEVKCDTKEQAEERITQYF